MNTLLLKYIIFTLFLNDYIFMINSYFMLFVSDFEDLFDDDDLK